MIEHLRLCDACQEEEIEALSSTRLSKAEKRLYESGEWLFPPEVKSEVLEHLRMGPDLGEDAAAELAARIRIALEDA